MDEGTKLKDLLPDRFDHLGEESRKELSRDETVSNLGLAWDYVESQLDSEIRGVLDLDVFELLGKAWANAKLLSAYADSASHPPGERELLKFGEYTFKRKLYPTVDVTIGSCPCVTLKFTLALAGEFTGLYLGIKDGHIIDGKSGKAWATAQLSYGDVPLHKKKESRKVWLPGKFKFDAPGIQIPRVAT